MLRRLSTFFGSNSAHGCFSSPSVVAYCTDVEGDFDFWTRYVKLSKVLERNTETGRLDLQKGAHFVFGGDAVDQGPGDLRFLEDIITLHKNHPGRVHIVLGNRDINKMRIAQELTKEHCSSHPWKTYTGVFWRGDYGIDHDEPDTLANRLRWILRCTMGSDRTFELRREELEILKQEKHGNNEHDLGVQDNEVVDSFVQSLHPNGLLREYLKLGNLGVVLGDTLFVHGGLSREVVGWVPPSSIFSNISHIGDSDDSVDSDGSATTLEFDARAWIDRLNQFCSSQMALFCKDIDHPNAKTSGDHWAEHGGYNTPFGGGDLIQYGMGWLPDRSRNNTVIYRDWISKSSEPPLNALPPEEDQPSIPSAPHAHVVEYLNQANINKVVCGHKPHGDASLIVRSQEHRKKSIETVCETNVDAAALTVLTLDTSYSGRTKMMETDSNGKLYAQARTTTGGVGSGNDDRRGCAVSELLLYFENDAQSSRAVVHGIDSFGDAYISEPSDQLIGYISCNDGWTVKGKRVKDGKLILGRLIGWDAENMYVDRDDFIRLETAAQAQAHKARL